MKPDHGKRRLIIREWMSLPGEKRRTAVQAAAFAAKAVETYKLAGGDDCQRVLGWLSPRTDKA